MKLQPPFRPLSDHVAVSLPGGEVLFTTRRGGVSGRPFESLNLGLTVPAPLAPEQADERRSVVANRERLAEDVGIPSEHFAHGRQVHGAQVAQVTELPGGAWSAARYTDLEPADGQATTLPGVAVAVLTADCLPVALIADGAVAMVHAGWRGLASGVLRAGVCTVRAMGGSGPMHAAIGPGARLCCYEVGTEVRETFAHHGPEVRDGSHLDLPLIAARELRAAGVAEVHDVGLCTICEHPSLFFSHRRDGPRTGRQAGVAWLN